MLPHIAVVEHDDLPRFRDVPHRANLTLVSSREVLGRKLDDRRRACAVARRYPRRWWYTRGGPPVHGWRSQQIVKLAAPRVVSTPGIVCIDSDFAFVRAVTAGDFCAADGQLHLYETRGDTDAEMAEWPAHAMRFLGIRASGRPLYRYTYTPVPFHRDVLFDLHAHIEREQGRPWDDAFSRAGMVMEYTLYGVYAREVDELRRVTPAVPGLTLYFWWPHEAARLRDTFTEKVRSSHAKIVCVQSNAGISLDAYRDLVQKAWTESHGDLSEQGRPVTKPAVA